MELLNCRVTGLQGRDK